MNNYWKNKNVLITGGSGFVGSNAVNFLLNLGANLTITISPQTSKSNLSKKLGNNLKKVKIIKADLLNSTQAKRACRDIEIVMNFAAIDGGFNFKLENPADIFSKNVNIALNMLEASAKTKIKTFLLVSSADVYIQTNSLLTEKSPLNINNKQGINCYIFAKLASEILAQQFSSQYGINIVIIRPTNLYGPADNFEEINKMRFIPTVIRKAFLGKEPITIWGNGKQLKSFLYIEDFLQICCKLIEKNVYGRPINVAGEQTISLKKLAEKIISLSGKPAKLIIDSSKSVGFKNRVFDLSFLKSQIGKVSETPLETGLKNTICYFKKNLQGFN